MALKNLLVHVDETRASAKRLDAAVALAQAHGAHLTGLYVAFEPNLPAYVAGQIPRDILDTQRAETAKEAEAAVAAMRAKLEKAGVAGDCRVVPAVDAQVAAVVAQHARYVDLAIAGQAEPEDAGPGGPQMVQDLVTSCGRPVLVVPYIGAGPTIGRTVTVAWDAGREAARAVGDAMPILETAERVHVLVVNPNSGASGHGAEPGADIALHLARHDIEAEVERVRSEGMEVGQIIQSWLADSGSDLLVMGAYAHSRVRDLVLGGVTRRMFDSMTVPVLMSH